MHRDILENIALRDKQNGVFERDADVVHDPVHGAADADDEESAGDIVDTVIGDIQRATNPAALQKIFAGGNEEVETDVMGLYRGTSLSESKPSAVASAAEMEAGARSEVVERPLEVMLNSVNDPLTGLPVDPPPFAWIIQLIDKEFPAPGVNAGSAGAATTGSAAGGISFANSSYADPRDHIDLRLLALYFPQLLQLCCSADGRNHMINIYILEIIVSLVVCCLGVWQSVQVLLDENQDAAYLMVVLTVMYSFYFAYEALKVKGVMILRGLQASPRPSLEEMLRVVVQAAYQDTSVNGGSCGSAPGDLDSENIDDEGDNSGAVPLIRHSKNERSAREYRLSMGTMQRTAATRALLCVLSFIAAYLTVHFTA